MHIKLGIAALLLLACSACTARTWFAPDAAKAQDMQSNALAFAQAETDTPAPSEVATDTPADTATPLPPPDMATPTFTPGPAPVLEAWTGEPTYPESLPDYQFLVQYDTALWSRGDDTLWEPSLVHKTISNCVIKQTSGRGQPPGWMVDDDSFQDIGTLRFEVVRVSHGGELQFINYFGGDGNVFTGFRVEFNYMIDECVRDAEAVIATLGSVLVPSPTPTITDTPVETPVDMTVTPTP
jgi:hypothetical protein